MKKSLKPVGAISQISLVWTLPTCHGRGSRRNWMHMACLENYVEKLWTLIDDCEFSRYAPGQTGDKNTMYARAENILSMIEENV